MIFLSYISKLITKFKINLKTLIIDLHIYKNVFGNNYQLLV